MSLRDVAEAVGWVLRGFFEWLADNPVIMFGSIAVLGLSISGLADSDIAFGIFLAILIIAAVFAFFLYKKEEKVATVVAVGIAAFAVVGLISPDLRVWFFVAAIIFDLGLLVVAYNFN